MQIKKCEQEIIKFGVWLTGHEQKDIEQMLNDYNNYKDNKSNLVEACVVPKIAELTIGQKIDAILLWQNSGKLHPLTCGCSATNNNEKKFEIISTRINGKPIFIECTRCGVIQDWIPESVYNYYIQSNFSA